MERLLATVSLLERDARLRREAAAWDHLHPTLEAPERLPIDLARQPLARRARARLAVRPTPRRQRAHGPAAMVVTPTMTRG